MNSITLYQNTISKTRSFVRGIKDLHNLPERGRELFYSDDTVRVAGTATAGFSYLISSMVLAVSFGPVGLTPLLIPAYFNVWPLIRQYESRVRRDIGEDC